MQRELERERAARLKALGVSQADEDLWRRALELLKAEGKWRPVLSAAVLRRADPASYELVVPWRQMQSRARECLAAVRAALEAALGRPVEVTVTVANSLGP